MFKVKSVLVISALLTACSNFIPQNSVSNINQMYIKEALPYATEKAIARVDIDLLNSAKLGNASSQYSLASYYHDNGAYEESFYWFEKSALQGYPAAQYYVALAYYNGKGIARDFSKSLYWFEKSALQGVDSAQYDLGTMYIEGEGTAKDFKKGLYWINKSAQSDFHLALYTLGKFYHQGQYVHQDSNKAIKLLEKAAKGYPPAQSYLGLILYNGEFVTQDKTKGLYWLEKAANRNHPDALYKVATIYSSGVDIQKDFYKANEFATKACVEHHKQEACSLMRELNSPR